MLGYQHAAPGVSITVTAELYDTGIVALPTLVDAQGTPCDEWTGQDGYTVKEAFEMPPGTYTNIVACRAS